MSETPNPHGTARPVAIITGGSSNIGWACVRRFAATHTVVIGDLKPPAEPMPEDVRFVATDITDERACAGLVEAAAALCREVGRAPASCAEARTILGLA